MAAIGKPYSINASARAIRVGDTARIEKTPWRLYGFRNFVSHSGCKLWHSPAPQCVVDRLIWGDKKYVLPSRKIFLDEYQGQPVQNLWNDIYVINSQSNEFVGYDTQKPEALLRRIIEASSNEGELVLDCFAGSGTSAAVAEKLNRCWIACDLGRFAVHTTRKRLLSISNIQPFVVQNLGKYERQAWAGAEFGDNQAAERQRAYTEFILKLASATPINGYTWLHGVKGGRMLHVGAVDAPVSLGDVTQIAAEFKRAIGTGKDAPKTNGIDVAMGSRGQTRFSVREVKANSADHLFPPNQMVKANHTPRSEDNSFQSSVSRHRTPIDSISCGSGIR